MAYNPTAYNAHHSYVAVRLLLLLLLLMYVDYTYISAHTAVPITAAPIATLLPGVLLLLLLLLPGVPTVALYAAITYVLLLQLLFHLRYLY